MKKLYYRYDNKTKVNVFGYVSKLILLSSLLGLLSAYIIK